MNKETIRNFYNEIIGYIEIDNQGNKTARDFYNKILGRYDAKQNVTRDFYNRIIARGDALVGLIYAEESKREEARKKKR